MLTMEQVTKCTTVLGFIIVFTVLGANCDHRHRHHHGWNKYDSSDVYPYKPNPRIICQESEEDVERIMDQAKHRCKCPTIYAPVCGTDNVTYQNRCILMCAANHQLKYQGFHRGKKLAVAKLEPCGREDEESAESGEYR